MDVQIVSGSSSLDASHLRKVAKYDNHQVKEAAAAVLHLRPDLVTVTSCTLSWRGVWSGASVEILRNGLGVPVGLLSGITTRVLQGSHTNWTRWGQITTRAPDVRTGVG